MPYFIITLFPISCILDVAQPSLFVFNTAPLICFQTLKNVTLFSILDQSPWVMSLCAQLLCDIMYFANCLDIFDVLDIF